MSRARGAVCQLNRGLIQAGSPLPDVAVHVPESERVALELLDSLNERFVGLLRTRVSEPPSNVFELCCTAVVSAIGRAAVGASGILPFSFRRQSAT